MIFYYFKNVIVSGYSYDSPDKCLINQIMSDTNQIIANIGVVMKPIRINIKTQLINIYIRKLILKFMIL